MADLLHDAQVWLAGQFQAYLSRAVTYVRGAQALSVLATPGRRLLKLQDDYDGVIVQLTDRDYLIPPASLAALGVPQAGDRLLDSVDGFTYQVQPYGPAEPAYQLDPEGTMYRIHTKRVA